MMGRQATGLARAFVEALGQATLSERASSLRELTTPNATWWIDCGRDRRAGRRDHNPGARRPWPLHGTMTVQEKLEWLSRLVPAAFPEGLGSRTVSRAFGIDKVALVEAEGEAVHANGKLYRNRYAFVIDVSDDRISRVREYLDTLHAEDVFGGDRLSERTEAPPPDNHSVTPANDAERLALALWRPLAAGDIDAFGALFASDGTWWTDSGTDRDRGDLSACGGPANGWPLHGLIPIEEKLRSMRARMRGAYARATIQVTPVRMFSETGLVALEAEGYARVDAGRVYQNRYVFVIETDGNRIRQVREYCDTLHVVDMVAGRPAEQV